MNLSEHSTDVVGFDSTWDADKQVLVRDSATETAESMKKTCDKGTGTESREIGVQASSFVISNSNEETDKKLASWLRKIMPALEKELIEGPTKVYDNNSASTSSHSACKISKYQEVDLSQNFGKNTPIFAKATFLSVTIQNNPVLAVACSHKEDTIASCFLIIYEPKRSKVDGNIYWQESVKIPLKQPLDFLNVNTENRDIFAGGSLVGEFYVWNYFPNATSAETKVVEIYSKTFQSSLTAFTFINNTNLLCCLNDGSMLLLKISSKFNITVDKILKINQSQLKESHVTAIINIERTNNFIIGYFNGKIYYCSIEQTLPHDDSFNPILRELHGHKFEVKSLKHCYHNRKNYIISCDASSEIFVHEIDEEANEKTLHYVIRLPLPIKNNIVLTNNIENMFCALSNGKLEIFNTKNNSRSGVVEENQSGNGNILEISRNESWLISGMFNGILNVYHVAIE